jgi:oxygen-independent coproporphyrinogen-3 oxidase
MCDFDLVIPEFETRHGLAFARYFAPELEALRPLAADGLVELTSGEIRVTPRGRMLVRNVAMLFDRHLRDAAEQKKYSRLI